MQAIDLLVTARWVIPVEPGGLVLEHHAIAVHGGRIEAVLPAELAMARYDARTHVDRPHHLVVPGFVNACTRATATLARGLGDGLAGDRWLRDIMAPLEQRWMGPEFVRDGTELAIAGLLAGGTTCFATVQLFPESAAATAATLHMRACVGLPVADGASPWAGTTDEYLAKGLALHDEYRDDPLITTAFAPLASDAITDATLQRVRRAADEIELPIIMTVHENAAARERPLARLVRLGLASPLLALVDASHTDQEDRAQLAERGVHVVHCPREELRSGSGISPVVALLAAGVKVAFGTGAGRCDDLDALGELRTAALIAAARDGDAAALDAHQLLRMATLNGARALGLADLTGSIVPGKWADLTCIDLGGIHTQPVHDPAAQLIHNASRAEVCDVWIAGRSAVSERHISRIDPEDLLARVARWGESIRTVQKV